MDRRAAVTTLLAAPLLGYSGGSLAAVRKRVGLLAFASTQSEMIANPRAFYSQQGLLDGLLELGWHEGRDVEFVWRSAEGKRERIRTLLDELIAMPVDVLVLNFWTEEAAARTRSIPIVLNMVGSSDHLRSDGSRNFPANITGTLWHYPESQGKALELLKAVVPKIRHVGVAYDERREGTPTKELLQAAQSLNVSLVPAPYSLDAPDAGLDRARAAGAEALYFMANPGTQYPARHKLLHPWIRRHRIAAIHLNLEAADTGGLIAYGPDTLASRRRTAYFVDRLLRGAKPEDLPLEQPKTLRLIVNVAAARAIGVTVPREIVLQADRLIQ